MARSGELERAVMDALWASSPCTSRQVLDVLDARPGARPTAPTTVLTVLSRLEAKGLVSRERQGRSHSYAPTATREAHTAALMGNLLDTSADRSAVLARFVGEVSPTDLGALRRALDALDEGEGPQQR